ncbi:MAG: glycosyltransferase family 39 protein [Acidobacteria bacterium]|nr:glycosyltransferase family 39 protein [Acidobacteriota bacterium]
MRPLLRALSASVERLTRPDAIARPSQRGILTITLLTCALLRLWTLQAPALDRTMWKEIDYLQISTSYWQHGYRFLSPEVSWPAEPPRVTAMELPLVPFTASLLYPVLGVNQYSVRLLPLAAWLFLSLFVFLLARASFGPVVALVAAGAAAAMPLPSVFGSILFSEPVSIAGCVAALHFASRHRDTGRRRDWWLGAAAFSIAVAVKLEPLYLTLPLAFLWMGRDGSRLRAAAGFARFMTVALLVPACWYGYAYWLSRTSLDVFGVLPFLGGHDKLQGATLLRTLSWYRTMEARLLALGWGWPGALLTVTGVAAAAAWRKGFVWLAYLTSVAIYFCVVAEGQTDAPYRQFNVVPALSTFAALGAVVVTAAVAAGWYALRGTVREVAPRRALAASGLILAVVSAPSLASLADRDPAVPASPRKWAVARQIAALVPAGSPIVVAGEYSIHKGGNDLSPVLYHYAGLRGWTLQRPDWRLARVEELAARGAALFCAVDMQREPDAAPFLAQVKRTFRVLAEGDNVLLVDLRRPLRAGTGPS